MAYGGSVFVGSVCTLSDKLPHKLKMALVALFRIKIVLFEFFFLDVTKIGRLAIL